MPDRPPCRTEWSSTDPFGRPVDHGCYYLDADHTGLHRCACGASHPTVAQLLENLETAAADAKAAKAALAKTEPSS